MNQAYLKNILSAKFDFDIWKDLLEKIFPKVEVFTSVAKIADSHVKDGGHVGNIRLDDGRSLAIFRFEVTDNVQISRNRRGRDMLSQFLLSMWPIARYYLGTLQACCSTTGNLNSAMVEGIILQKWADAADQGSMYFFPEI